MGKYYIDPETIEKARINYEKAMQEVQKAIDSDSKDLKEKIDYMRFLGSTYRSYIRSSI